MRAHAPPVVFRPAPPFVVLRRPGVLVSLLLLMVLVVWARGSVVLGGWANVMVGAAGLGLLGVLVWNEVVRRAERYTLTGEAATWESGVFSRLRVDVPLHQVQNTVMHRSLGERLLGVGTIAAATAGTDGYELVWSSVALPKERLAELRRAAEGARGAEDEPVGEDAPAAGQGRGESGRAPIIGLAGGIGSGKSTVAALLAERGCLVIDSDQRARAALDREDVRTTLVGWWGRGVLGADGRIDRGRVASIVFGDAAQRERLEGLVHPIIRQDRAAMIAEAGGMGRPVRAVVIDAPLLFEAGLDRDCDAVIFVESTREERLARARAARGWTEEEMMRREAAQWAPEEKKKRATHVVENGADRGALGTAVGKVLEEIAPLREREGAKNR